MTKVSEIEDSMEGLEDIDDLAEKIGSEDRDEGFENDILNAELEHAEEKIKSGNDQDEYYLLDDFDFEKMEFESWDEEDIVPPIQNVHEYKQQMVELAFGDLLSEAQIEDLRECLDWRDVYVALQLQKEGHQDKEMGLRLRGYFRFASSSVKSQIEDRADLQNEIDSTQAIIPEFVTANIPDRVANTEQIIEPEETVEEENTEYIEVEKE